MESAVTPLVRLAFYFYNKIFKYWYPFYFKVDHNTPNLAVNYISNRRVLAPWFMEQIVTFFINVSLPVYILIRELAFDTKQLDVGGAAVLLLFAFYKALISTVVMVTWKHNFILCASFNCFTEMEHRMIQGERRKVFLDAS